MTAHELSGTEKEHDDDVLERLMTASRLLSDESPMNLDEPQPSFPSSISAAFDPRLAPNTDESFAWTGLGLPPSSSSNKRSNKKCPEGPITPPDSSSKTCIFTDHLPMNVALRNHSEPNYIYNPSVTPQSISESFCDRARDPRRSIPTTPSVHRSCGDLRDDPPNLCTPSESEPSTRDDFESLSISDEEPLDEPFESHIQISPAFSSAQFSHNREPQLPKLLYRAWNERSGGSNSDAEFRPGLSVTGLPPERSKWDLRFLEHAAGHFNRADKPSPFISFSRTFIMVQIAIRKMISDPSSEPQITIVDPDPARLAFLYAAPICWEVRKRGLANAETMKYTAWAEWFHWGPLGTATRGENPILHTVSLASLLTLADENAGVRTVLRVNSWQQRSSVRTILKELVKTPIKCDENVASGLALIARTCGFNMSSKNALLSHFISDLANGCVIQPCSPEVEDVIAAAFTRTFIHSHKTSTLFSHGVKHGYMRWITWAQNQARCKRKTKTHCHEKQDAFSKKLPFEEQAYRGTRARTDGSTDRLTRSASVVRRDKDSSNGRSHSSGRSRSRGAYHPERMVRSHSLQTPKRKRKSDGEDYYDDSSTKRRKSAAVDLTSKHG
ncbi:hypothetical protein EV356DRAFT_537980 [Viridothelium virens]|uniref:DUF7587 domain-containing protein n=1 Tax=Viridothelium virens TaxID=1048519 RepID=A0A6A6GSS7_VIRVR|nr:hypothetical protein EV356DRAFT_537980 [Viridothelium virens]